MQGDNISTVGEHQYCGGYSVQWEDTFSIVGDTFSTVGDNISTVEVAQYSGDRDVKYYEFSIKPRHLFQSLFCFKIRPTTSQASIVDHG